MPKVFFEKKSALLGNFHDIGTFGDMGTDMNYFVQKLKTRRRSKSRHNFKSFSILKGVLQCVELRTSPPASK